MRIKIRDKLHDRRFITYCLLGMICFALGFALTLQIRSVYRINNQLSGTGLAREEDLQKQLEQTQEKNMELNTKINTLQDTIQNYRQEAAKSGDYADALNKQLSSTEILAGLRDVHGPGVTLTMKDADWVETTSDPSAYVIHDTDILQVLNELRDAGVEAMSLNGERILATTEVRCAGNTVSINNNRYDSPFVIKAIGDPDKLRSALLIKGGIVDMLGAWGITVDIVQSSDIQIKAYDGTPVFKYAVPDSK